MINDYNFPFFEAKGKELFGNHFTIYPEDVIIFQKLIAYFLQDQQLAEAFSLDLRKGVLLSGPIGCGKTSIMLLMRNIISVENRYAVRSCREITFEFIKDGYEVINRFGSHSFSFSRSPPQPIIYCFDDLGSESSLKYFGNECNVMGEILLSRYDCFVSRGMLTHATTNLSASELESFYGNRVRSRMREMFNLIAFDKTSKDKRR